jgi:hypothetical protein
MFHMPHGQSFGYLYPSLINRLVGETLKSGTLRCKLPCSTCCKAGTEQLANREAVGGGGRRNGRLHCLVCTPPRKIRVHFQGYKHTSLTFLVVTFYELRFDGVLRRSLARRWKGRLEYKGNLITFNTKITHLSDAPSTEDRYDGAVGQHGWAEESRPLYAEARPPSTRSPMVVCDGAGLPGKLGQIGDTILIFSPEISQNLIADSSPSASIWS